MDWNTWGPPLVVLGLSALAGLVLGLRARGASVKADPREALTERKAQLMEQLRALELERGKLSEAAYAEQKEGLVHEAADVLRALEAPEDVEPISAPPAGGGVRALWALGSAAFIGIAAVVMVKSAAPRQDGMAAASPQAQQQQQMHPELSAALETLEEDPEDLEALNLIGHFAIMNRQVDQAMQYVDRARAIAPEDPEVLTHLAAMQLMVGMYDRVDDTISKVLEKTPGFNEAKIWQAVSYVQRGRFDEAQALLEEVRDSSTDPDEKAAAVGLLAQLETVKSGAGAQASAGASAAAGGGSQASAGPAKVAGTVALPEGQSPPDVPLMFVYVRSSAEERGPPLAAVRIPMPREFPYDFKLNEGNLIRGGDWPAEVWIKARVPAGGDPMKRSPEDWESEMLGPISAGTTDVALTLAPAGS